MREEQAQHPRLALALGSGSARGWSHIGVLRALEDNGIRPDIITGTSIGALVGGAYASGNLDALEEWIRPLDRLDIVRLMDARLRGGGFIRGERLFARLSEQVNDCQIEDLPIRFAAVSCELATGREVWHRKGSLLNAIRASVSLPGIFTPTPDGDRFLIDGGLVNPVPISVARALGANLVLAVNLNDGLVARAYETQHGRDFQTGPDEEPESQTATLALEHSNEQHESSDDDDDEPSAFWKKLSELNGAIKLRFDSLISEDADDKQDRHEPPGIFDVVMGSINVMQDRITRSRMAGDPPDAVIAPRVHHIGLMAFDKAEEAIEEGYRAAERLMPDLKYLLGIEEPRNKTTGDGDASEHKGSEQAD
jgi:NTE family protein